MNYRQVVALDFDGVLHQYKGWNEGKLGIPIDGALDAVLTLQENGCKVKVFSAREPESIRGWLAQHGFPALEVTDRKEPEFSVFVDDRALRFHGTWDAGQIARIVDHYPYWKEGNDKPNG